MTRLLLACTSAAFLAGCLSPVDACPRDCDAGSGGGGGSGGSGGSGGGAVAGGGGGGGGPLTGALSVTVEGLTWPAAVSLEGPSGFKRDLTGSVVLTELATGSYLLRAKNVTDRDAVATQVFVPDPAVQTLTVAASQTTSATVKYEADVTTGLVYLVSHVDVPPSVGPLRAYVRVFQASDFKTGGLKNPLHVAELPNCRAGRVLLDPRDRIWILCGTRQFTAEWRRFRRAQLGSEQKPIPEATLSVAGTVRTAVDRQGHVWSWDPANAWVGKHADSDFDVVGDAGFPVADGGFTRASPHQPRFFLEDGSLLAWDLPTQSLGQYEAAALVGASQPVSASKHSSFSVNLGAGSFARTDIVGLYARFAQQLYELPASAFAGDGGTLVPVKDFRVPQMHEYLVTIDASKRYWGYEIQKKVFVVLTPNQLAMDSGTELTAAWEVSWPLADPKEQDGLMLLYPPPHGQRQSGF